jgi:hypothetical protein
MIKKMLIASATVFMLSCNNSANKQTPQSPAMNTLTNEEKKEGWELLFDGESTKGWHKYGNKPVGQAWKVVDGTLYFDSTYKAKEDGGDIVTENEFDNFHLKYDWKIAVNGNSGVIFYAQEDSKYTWPWETGPEMQVLDNNGHPDAKIIKHRAGDLYDLISSSKETVKPAMEWNTAEIKSVNGKLDLYLNGENIVSTTMWDDNWRKLIAGSKFKIRPDFGKYQKGRIGLQDHGNNVWFRNIKIKRM